MSKNGVTSQQSKSALQKDNLSFQFVNYDLTVSDKATLKEVSRNWDDCFQVVSQLTQEGYKLSFSWDSYSDCFAGYLSGVGKQCPNQGFILGARGNNPLKVVNALLYKHLTIFDGVWHDRVLGTKPDDDY